MTENNLDRTTIEPGSKDAGLVKIDQPILSYDADADVLTFDSYKFHGDLMRQITASPCGISFRIINRADGVVTIAQDRDSLAFAAPDLDQAADDAWKALAWAINYDSEDKIFARTMQKIEDARKKAGTFDYDLMRKKLESDRAALSKAKGE